MRTSPSEALDVAPEGTTPSRVYCAAFHYTRALLFASDPKIQEFFGQMFEGQPDVQVFATTKWSQWRANVRVCALCFDREGVGARARGAAVVAAGEGAPHSRPRASMRVLGEIACAGRQVPRPSPPLFLLPKTRSCPALPLGLRPDAGGRSRLRRKGRGPYRAMALLRPLELALG